MGPRLNYWRSMASSGSKMNRFCHYQLFQLIKAQFFSGDSRLMQSNGTSLLETITIEKVLVGNNENYLVLSHQVGEVEAADDASGEAEATDDASGEAEADDDASGEAEAKAEAAEGLLYFSESFYLFCFDSHVYHWML
ncbi:hypothetical protein FXO38_04530 [Capsicum annuum]|nr:hypothetical protein FXO37_29507 [Capsicum annuum]KAF3676002.1 hypothetical protein FXO38_04530 [Capsicum annuum]